MAAPSTSDVMARAELARVRFTHLQFVDILGVIKSVTVPFAELENALDQGKWFDGSALENFARIAESDMFLVPDRATFQVLPWERDGQATARVVCSVYTPNGDPFPGDTRHVLVRALAEARKLGFEYRVGPEIEFFLFRPGAAPRQPPQPHDAAGYFDLSTDPAARVREEMIDALEQMGIRVNAAHHEVADGQHEIDLEHDTALRMADNVVTCRYAVKAVARGRQLLATFMPKPIAGVSGSGMHTHQSLAAIDGGANVFYDANDDYGLSDLGKQFLAGQLAHARGMCAVLAPTVNSYKRLTPGFEAPVSVNWGRINRSALLRTPKSRPGKAQGARIELRCPDPSCNPYLAFAVMLAAGLDGIRRRLSPPRALEEHLFHQADDDRSRHEALALPRSLGEALDQLDHDEVTRQALGDYIYERFVEAKTMEWDQYRTTVSPWELQRYLESY